MIRIEKSENGDVVTFVLSGRMQKEDLHALKTLLKNHKRQAVVLDLEGVKLVDRDAVEFLAGFDSAGSVILGFHSVMCLVFVFWVIVAYGFFG